MAITNASRLADFGSGIGTEGAVLQFNNATQRVGIGTTNPQTTLDVNGTYRQALRDLPETYPDPADIVWPVAPLNT